MEEEKKVVEAEVVETKQPEEAPQQKAVDAESDVKNALMSFIFAAAGFILAASGIGMLVCGIIGLVMYKKIQGPVEKKPHAIFMKIAKPVAIVDIILGALVIVGLLIWLIVWLIMVAVAAAAAAAEAGSYLAFLF